MDRSGLYKRVQYTVQPLIVTNIPLILVYFLHCVANEWSLKVKGQHGYQSNKRTQYHAPHSCPHLDDGPEQEVLHNRVKVLVLLCSCLVVRL
jgi:hypothetical protein